MNIERLKELKGITEQLYQDGNVPLTYCDDILELTDEAIARQSVKSEDVADVEEDDTYSQCEECGQFYLDSRGYDYCPNCGRKLKENER